MIELVPIGPENLSLYREVRLSALSDSPLAFGSTYTREASMTEQEWRARAERWNGPRSVAYLAVDGDSGCGIVAGAIDEEDPARAWLLSMWVRPNNRSAGVGRRLVEAVTNWAREYGLRDVALHVTSGNDQAAGFYERLGFVYTGRTEPYPNDPNLHEREMVMELGGP